MKPKNIKICIEEYKNLPDSEKIRRLEYLTSLYMGWLGVENYREGWMLDCTHYWAEHEKQMEGNK